MDQNTVLLFTHNGLGSAPDDLRLMLAVKFLTLINDAGVLPAKILFYTDGVKLVCQGSPNRGNPIRLPALGCEVAEHNLSS